MQIKIIKKLIFVIAVFAVAAIGITMYEKAGRNNASDDTEVKETVLMNTSGMKPVVSSDSFSLEDQAVIKAAFNKNLELYYRETDGAIMVKDIRNGYLWSSVSDKSKLENYDNINDLWKSKISSLLIIKYYDYSDNQGVPIEINTAGNDAEIAIKKIDNGIDIHYAFKEIQIELHLVITLDEDSIAVKIPFEGITEHGNYKLTGIDILPMFGAAGTEDNGYVFYPDGCGAISRFDTKRVSTVASQYRWTVYGNDVIDMDIEKQEDERGIKTAMLPVFGVKNDQNAFAAVISEGAADSTIVYSPSGVGINLNRIYAETVYRRQVDESILNSSASEGQPQEKIQRFYDEIQEKDMQINYFFLFGENADYSGMANRCRDYFEEAGLINKVTYENENIPLAIELFMGIKEKRALVDNYIALTDFDQASKILDEISAIYKGRLLVSLSGWAKGGYDRYPTLPAADRHIGGDSGLKQLSAYIEGKDWDLYLNTNLMKYDKRFGGYSLTKDVIYYGNTLQVTDKTSNIYLFNVNRYFDKYIYKYQEFAKEFNVGLALESYGKGLYYDYNDSHFRDEIASRIADGVAKLKQNGIKTASEGNLYMLGSSDYLINIPQSDSLYDITDEAVPFYQMVVHGLIPYTSEPGNLASDYRKQMLKWVEYGCVPYYRLTYDQAGDLKFTAYNTLFSSSYRNWLDEIQATVDEYGKMADAWKYKMVKHEKLDEGVYCVTYDNGEKIYVNYNDKAISVDSITVDAMNWKVIKP